VLQAHLERLFEDQRLVFWHDPAAEHADRLESLELAGVEILRVANDEYAIKHQVLLEQPGSKFLVYRSGPVPSAVGNWLLDLELAYGVFTADRSSLVLQELRLTGDGISEVVHAHDTFFASSKRVERLKELVRADDNAVLIRAKMSAVLLGQREHSLEEITRSLLIENAGGTDGGYQALVEHGLDAFYWGGVAQIYRYQSPNPTIDDFVLWIFRQAMTGFKAEGPEGLHNIRRDFDAFCHRPRSQKALMKLAERAAEDLDFGKSIEDAPYRELVENFVFEQVDQKLISDLARAVADRTVPAAVVSEVVRARQRSLWIDKYRGLYTAIDCASELLTALHNAELKVRSFDAGLARYRDEWFRIDQLYRHFSHAARLADYPESLTVLRERVEAFYANSFLFKLGEEWQKQVDSVERWRSDELRPQTSFFNDHVRPIIADGRRKAVVIISDALRYEVAEELRSRLRQEDGLGAEIDAMLGVLPSYTQLGMAALLPHKTIGHAPDGDPVLVDGGRRTDGTPNRDKVLKTVNGHAIQAEEIFSLSRDRLRALYQQHQVLYVYHDRIDAIGDKFRTESQVFEAAEDTLKDLVRLVKKLASAAATNLLITADHGFLFQDSDLADGFNLSTRPEGDKVLFKNRRYVFGRELKADSGFTTFTAAQLGLASDFDVQIPKSVLRLPMPGAGSRFVHGGASLQEIVVPVLTVNKKRKSDTRPVEVKILPDLDKITTGQVVVRLFQADPVSDKVRPRTLRAGLYVGEDLISNQVTLVFDEESTDRRDRYQEATLLLARNANEYNNRPVEFRLEEQIPKTDHWRTLEKATYTLRRSFTSDFDFLGRRIDG
jgi:uncharacterized protein (TIGR02687 family)